MVRILAAEEIPAAYRHPGYSCGFSFPFKIHKDTRIVIDIGEWTREIEPWEYVDKTINPSKDRPRHVMSVYSLDNDHLLAVRYLKKEGGTKEIIDWLNSYF